MERKLLKCVFNINSLKFVVANVHLESLNARKKRKEQLKIVKEHLKLCQTRVICGDFNFDSKRNFLSSDKRKLENDWLKKYFDEYIDVWDELNPNDNGFTFNTDINYMLASHPHEQMRYDRILLSNSTDSLFICKPNLIQIFGNKQTSIEPDDYHPQTFISDHFGIKLCCSLVPK